MKTINTVLQRIKKVIDNDSYLYVFKNASWGEAYTRNILYSKWDADVGNTYYAQCVLPRIITEGVVNVYYKNSNGVWIDVMKYQNTFATTNIVTGSVMYQNICKVDNSILPRTIFMDSDHMIYYIDAHDGDTTDIPVTNVFIDEIDDNVVSVQPYSIDDPTLPFTARHVMPDVKVRVKNVSPSNLFVWFNGVFVPIVKDAAESDVFYIRNGMILVNTINKEQRIDAPVNFIKDATYRTATVNEVDSYNVYRYDFNIRLFQWKNVSVSDWVAPISTLTAPISYNYGAVYVQKTLIFDVDVNINAHMIIENGAVLDPSEYTVDAANHKKVTLLNVEQHGYNILNEVISDIAVNPNYYGTISPLKIIESTLTEKTYSLVNFTTSVVGKNLYLKQSKACAVDFPYRNEITFSKVNIGDLVLIEGVFTPYEWEHRYTIRLPNKKYKFNSMLLRAKEENVSRLYFVCK